MKKAVPVLSILFCAIILFFSFFGEKLYYSTKPQVELDRPLRVNDMVLLPGPLRKFASPAVSLTKRVTSVMDTFWSRQRAIPARRR